MKLENQVCSLENARKLDDLGMRRESLFSYQRFIHTEGSMPRVRSNRLARLHQSYKVIAPTYTVAELGEILGNKIDVRHRLSPDRKVILTSPDWSRGANCYSNPIHFEADTEANARALMLIWLLENKHVTAEEINQ